jgi:hypothetical protein
VRAGIYNFPGLGRGMEGSSPSGLFILLFFLGLNKKKGKMLWSELESGDQVHAIRFRRGDLFICLLWS